MTLLTVSEPFAEQGGKVTQCCTRQPWLGGGPSSPTVKQTFAPETAVGPLIVTVTLVEAPGASGGMVTVPGVIVSPPPVAKFTAVTGADERLVTVNV
jgi:hypothetical protein